MNADRDLIDKARLMEERDKLMEELDELTDGVGDAVGALMDELDSRAGRKSLLIVLGALILGGILAALVVRRRRS
jgi:hypothetical protein